MNESDKQEVVETVVTAEETAVNAGEAEASTVAVDTHGLFSGNQNGAQPPYENRADVYGGPFPYGTGQMGSAYGGQSPYGNQNGTYGGQSPYGNQSGTYGGQSPYGSQSGAYGGQSPYGNQNGAYGAQPPYGSQGSAYGGQFSYENQNGAYSAQPPYGSQGSAYGGQSPYGNQNGAYGGQSPYGNQSGAYGGQSPYGNQNGAYGGQSSYGNQQAGGGYGGQPPFGGQPPYNNPYSPYAAPQKKKNTGLIVGTVVAIIVLFLVAIVALAGKMINLLSEREKNDSHHDVYDFDDYDSYDDYSHDGYDDYDDYFQDDYDDYFYDYGDGYDGADEFDYDDFYGDGYDDAEYDDRYYDLHNEIRSDLTYQVKLEDYEYETSEENVAIIASIPVISGDNVPNLDKMNEVIRKEVEETTELFETEYESHVKESEENYFMASLVGYVAYMDEDKMSVVYQEEIYSDRDGGVYLKCINIDMNNGVILDNGDILAVDDAFSVEFRKKNDEQNGEIPFLTYLTDQQITDYFNSDNIIVFYTPNGMEIGFNYEEGWVTVTYEDYEKYLKVF